MYEWTQGWFLVWIDQIGWHDWSDLWDSVIECSYIGHSYKPVPLKTWRPTFCRRWARDAIFISVKRKNVNVSKRKQRLHFGSSSQLKNSRILEWYAYFSSIASVSLTLLTWSPVVALSLISVRFRPQFLQAQQDGSLSPWTLSILRHHPTRAFDVSIDKLEVTVVGEWKEAWPHARRFFLWWFSM